MSLALLYRTASTEGQDLSGDAHLAPLSALVQGAQELLQGLRVQREHIAGAGLPDVCQCRHSVRHHHRIGVGQQILQLPRIISKSCGLPQLCQNTQMTWQSGLVTGRKRVAHGKTRPFQKYHILAGNVPCVFCAVAATRLLCVHLTFSRSRKPLSSTSSGLMSKSFATQTAAVLRT